MARALRDVGDQGERGVPPGRHAARGEEELLLLCAAFFLLDKVLHPPRLHYPLRRRRRRLRPARGERGLVRSHPLPVQRPRRAQQPRSGAHGEYDLYLRGGGRGLQPLLHELIVYLPPHALAARHQDHVWDQLVELFLLALPIAVWRFAARALRPRDLRLLPCKNQSVRRNPTRTGGAVPQLHAAGLDGRLWMLGAVDQAEMRSVYSQELARRGHVQQLESRKQHNRHGQRSPGGRTVWRLHVFPAAVGGGTGVLGQPFRIVRRRRGPCGSHRRASKSAIEEGSLLWTSLFSSSFWSRAPSARTSR